MKILTWSVSVLFVFLIILYCICVKTINRVVDLREKINTKLSEADILKNQYQDRINNLDKKSSELNRSLQKGTKNAAQIYKEANFVVAITAVSVTEEMLNRASSPNASGYIIEINSQIYIVTAHHVCFEAGIMRRQIDIHFKGLVDGHPVNTEEATLVGACEYHDIALLQFKNKKFVFPWPSGQFAPSKNIEPGHRVFAIGSPLGSFLSISEGTVMSTDIIEANTSIGLQKCAQIMRHDALVNPGNSGGPILDDFGRIIGMNISLLGGANENKTGLAIPSDCILKDANSIAANQKINHANIDANFENSWELSKYHKYWLEEPPKQRGIIVTSVAPGSEAAKSGLKHSDLILLCDGVMPSSAIEVRETITHKEPNNTLKLLVRHENGFEEELNIKVSPAH